MSKVSIKEIPDGPLRLSIDTNEDTIENILFDENGKTIPIKKNSIICRCGKSKTQPFCDGVHRMCGFKSSNTLDEEIIQRYEDKGLVGENTTEDYEGCKITIIKNGPMHVLGKVDLHVDKWSTNVNQQKYSLCRCGTSENKPFCDYTHASLKMKNYTF